MYTLDGFKPFCTISFDSHNSPVLPEGAKVQNGGSIRCKQIGAKVTAVFAIIFNLLNRIYFCTNLIITKWKH